MDTLALLVQALVLTTTTAMQPCTDLVAGYNASQPAAAGIQIPIVTYTITLQNPACRVEAGAPKPIVSQQGVTVVIKAPPTRITITIACPASSCTTTLEPKHDNRQESLEAKQREQETKSPQGTPWTEGEAPEHGEAVINKPASQESRDIEDLILYTAVAAVAAGAAVEALSSRKKRKNSLPH